MKLKGNTVLITGGTSGIGTAFAEKFLEEENRVLICGRREERLQQLKQKYPSLHTKVCDVTKAADREALAQWAIENFRGEAHPVPPGGRAQIEGVIFIGKNLLLEDVVTSNKTS